LPYFNLRSSPRNGNYVHIESKPSIIYVLLIYGGISLYDTGTIYDLSDFISYLDLVNILSFKFNSSLNDAVSCLPNNTNKLIEYKKIITYYTPMYSFIDVIDKIGSRQFFFFIIINFLLCMLISHIYYRFVSYFNFILLNKFSFTKLCSEVSDFLDFILKFTSKRFKLSGFFNSFWVFSVRHRPNPGFFYHYVQRNPHSGHVTFDEAGVELDF